MSWPGRWLSVAAVVSGLGLLLAALLAALNGSGATVHLFSFGVMLAFSGLAWPLVYFFRDPDEG